MAVYQVGGAALSVLPFTDVDARDVQAVRYVCENGLMAGVSADRFEPNGTLTRGEAVTALWALEGRPVVNYLMDFSDVAEGRCPLVRAAVNHPDLPGLALLTAPMTLSPALTEEAVRRMLDTARSLYDYVLIDSPAGLGAGFRMACCGADRAIVVSTNDASSLRDAQRTVGELDFLRQIHLVMNRIQPKLLRQLRTTIDDAMDTAGLPLLGVVPEDPQVMLSANLGRPLILGGRQGAANACLNIAKRLEGRRVPIMRIR